MWKIKIHKLVLEKDFKKISQHDRNILLKTIYKKLTINPEQYGAPLRGELKGYWKLKVSHYRVVYRIEKSRVAVLVLKIGMRRDKEVYKEMLLRMSILKPK
jgi:mRNA interferase RelE/StbE